MRNGIIFVIASMFACMPVAALARDHIHIVGSSTLFPFITTVAEEFGQKSPFSTPIVEQLGTGGGFNLFCNGLGARAPFDYPDIANASRKIKKREIKRCKSNGVEDILEIKIGYDGIVFANALSGPEFVLTTQHLYLALAAHVPVDTAAGPGLQPNPHAFWSDISSDLPQIPIKVLGPPQTSGTRDALNTLAMKAGCRTLPAIQALKQGDPQRFETACTAVREDQRYIEAGENDNLIVQKLRADPTMVGVLPYSFMEQNTDVLKAATINGFPATPETLRQLQYPVVRSMYIYVKTAHARAVPGMVDFLEELLSDEAMGRYGYLVDKGLITLPESQRALFRRRIETLSNEGLLRSVARPN